MPLPSRFSDRAASLALVLLSCALTACVSDPLPTYGVVIETSTQREAGVSTRFGIVSVGAEQDRGEVRVTAFYGDGPATERGLIEPVGDRLCRIKVPFPTPWCELSSVLPVPGERLTLAGYSPENELWFREVPLAEVPRAKGILFAPPQDLPVEWLLPGTGLFRWEVDRWRLVGLLVAELELGGATWLLAHGPVELSRAVTADHQRNVPEDRPYRQDVRPR
ncbi:MAG: hypothetical protein JNM84_00420 [Planctomycetes bacterium]|nr:hypothetical protein [Planctomycetota bacterium]